MALRAMANPLPTWDPVEGIISQRGEGEKKANVAAGFIRGVRR